MHLTSTGSSAISSDISSELTSKSSFISTKYSAQPYPVLSNSIEWCNRGNIQSSLSDICTLLDMAVPFNSARENIIFQHVHYKAGKRIYTLGQNFDNLYIVNSGFLKTILVDEYGNEQVLSFPMKGDLLGIDAIHSKRHSTELVALTDCDLILLPYQTFSTLARTYVELEQAMFSVMSRELVRDQLTIGMLSALGAEAKVARFLTTLGERFSQMGYSGKIYNLRMTRLEIASYLGLAIETVSRTLSAFHEQGLIIVYQKQIDIIDAKSLATLRKLPQSKPKSNLITMSVPAASVEKIKTLNLAVMKKSLRPCATQTTTVTA